MAVAGCDKLATALARLEARLSRGQPLDNAIAGEHAAIDGKVSAYHEGAHSGVFLCQLTGLVGEIGLVLAAIHRDKAGVAIGLTVNLIHRFMPSTTPAEACETFCVSSRLLDPAQ